MKYHTCMRRGQKIKHKKKLIWFVIKKRLLNQPLLNLEEPEQKQNEMN